MDMDMDMDTTFACTCACVIYKLCLMINKEIRVVTQTLFFIYRQL